MFSSDDHRVLKERYEEMGALGDDRATAMDFNLRELEIDTAAAYMKDGDSVLDVGCATGYSLREYARRYAIQGTGVDYAENMVKTACERTEREAGLRGTISYHHASVLELPFPDDSFDVITSARCLMALLDWSKQKAALRELQRVLRPTGLLVLMEGTIQGLARLNEFRSRFRLPEIPVIDRDRLLTLKFDEDALVAYGTTLFDLVKVHRFGMYYFLTRVVHPLLVAPDAPRNDSGINAVAREIAKVYPNFEDLGHLVAFVWRKRRADGDEH